MVKKAEGPKKVYKTTLKERERSARYRKNNVIKIRNKRRKSYKKNRMSWVRYHRFWRKTNYKRWMEIATESCRKSRYGLTKENFEDMIKKQNNKCAICNLVFIITPRIDHCHKSNKIRGLLCNTCNSGIGLLKDNPKILRKAAQYIERNKNVKKNVRRTK